MGRLVTPIYCDQGLEMSSFTTRIKNQLLEIFYELSIYMTIENLKVFLLAILPVYEGNQVEM